jgi:hypothetical protein
MLPCCCPALRHIDGARLDGARGIGLHLYFSSVSAINRGNVSGRSLIAEPGKAALLIDRRLTLLLVFEDGFDCFDSGLQFT